MQGPIHLRCRGCKRRRRAPGWADHLGNWKSRTHDLCISQMQSVNREAPIWLRRSSWTYTMVTSGTWSSATRITPGGRQGSTAVPGAPTVSSHSARCWQELDWEPWEEAERRAPSSPRSSLHSVGSCGKDHSSPVVCPHCHPELSQHTRLVFLAFHSGSWDILSGSTQHSEKDGLWESEEEESFAGNHTTDWHSQELGWSW